jgi:hypothetical protein
MCKLHNLKPTPIFSKVFVSNSLFGKAFTRHLLEQRQVECAADALPHAHGE